MKTNERNFNNNANKLWENSVSKKNYKKLVYIL